jgi:hypothetical protein
MQAVHGRAAERAQMAEAIRVHQRPGFSGNPLQRMSWSGRGSKTRSICAAPLFHCLMYCCD